MEKEKELAREACRKKHGEEQEKMTKRKNTIAERHMIKRGQEYFETETIE